MSRKLDRLTAIGLAVIADARKASREARPKAKLYVNVNMHVIRQNRKTGAKEPPIRMSRGRRGKPQYSQEILFLTPRTVRVVYSPDAPLPCGARCWIEIEP